MHRTALLVVLISACGDDEGVRPLKDAPTLDASPGTATVTVRAGRQPIANHTVYFQGPDSSEIATVQTDADGRASAVVPAGSSVTTLDLEYYRNKASRSIVTIMGVKPGDDLAITGSPDLLVESARLDVVIAPYTGVPSPLYAMRTTCGDASLGDTTSSSYFSLLCSPRIDALVRAVDSSNRDVAYVAVLDQAIDVPLDLTGVAWTPLTSSGTTYTNIPAATYIESYRRLVTPRGELLSCSDVSQNASSTYTASMDCPTIPGVTMVDTLVYTDVQTIWEVTQPVATPASTIDVANMAVRAPSSPNFDGAARTISWSESQTGATPEFVTLWIEDRSHPNPNYWEIIAPYDGASITLPTLVGEAAEIDLAPTTVPYVIVRTGTATGGYDAIRPHGPFFERSLTSEISRILTARPYDG